MKFHILELLGSASMNIGRVEEAYETFEKAEKYASDEYERTLLLHLKTRSLSSGGKISDAWVIFQEALKVIGHPYPQSKIAFTLSIFWYMFVTYFLSLTGFGYGRLASGQSKEEKKRKFHLICAIYETAYMNAYLMGSPLDLAQITFRQFVFAYFLGDSRELGKAHSVAALLWGLSLVKPLMNYHLRKAQAIADKLNDPALKVYVRAYLAVSTEFSGDSRGSTNMCREIYPEAQKYLGTWVCSQLAADLMHQYYYRGMTREAVDWYNSTRDYFRNTNNYCLMANMHGAQYHNLTLLGRIEEAMEVRKEWLKTVEKVNTVKYSLANVHANSFISMYEQEIFGPELEDHIQRLLDYGLEDYHYKYNHIVITQVRLASFARAQNDSDRLAARKRLNWALFNLNVRAMTPIYRCHYYALKGAILRMDGKFKRALHLLEKAERDAHRSGSFYGHFVVARERARVYLALGQNLRAECEARMAQEICLRQGWTLRLKQLQTEFARHFSLESENSILSQSLNRKSTNIGSLTEKRTLDSLLQVSLATSLSLNPEAQVKATLDEIVRVLGAERAYVFWLNEETGELEFKAGRHADSTDAEEPQGYSSTVVKTVFQEQQPLVVTGSDEMEAIGSQSAVVRDLRSIMAAPLFLREKFLGVIYVDSRLAKGLFDVEDVEILVAIASHIAISFEISRMAVVEVERTNMAKDLELSATVQKLFLPKNEFVSYRGADLSARYRPATQCGGDWWWHQESQERLSWVVADVTGHGAGPAMITAIVACCFNIFRDKEHHSDMNQVLERTHNVLRDLTKGEYWMTVLAFDLDFATGQLRVFSAGGPHFFVIPKNGKPVSHLMSSSLLGSESFNLGSTEINLSPGDRIFVCTDGVFEMKNESSTELGERRLMKILAQSNSLKLKEASAYIESELDSYRKETAQEDDITFVLLERLSGDAA